MCDESGLRNPVEVLAEEFLARQRQGEQPSLGEYAQRHPELAEEIHDLFPVLLDMEDARQAVAEAPFSMPQALGTFPERLGDYRVLREIGRGGMGVVYEAEQVSLGRRVALKVLSRAGFTPLQALRFEREARSAARLHHTNIVPVFGVGREGDLRYYVMQYIPGQPLDEVFNEVRRLREKPDPPLHFPGPESAFGPADPPVTAGLANSLWTGQFASPRSATANQTGLSLAAAPTEADSRSSSSTCTAGEPAGPESGTAPASEVLSSSADLTRSGSRYCRAVAQIGVQVADALDYAAEQGIIHRDVKPSNILLDVYGIAWVTDFGLAKVAGQNDLTHSGDLVGTLRYMAPERFRGETDRRSDVYALGLTLYEMLALQPAFSESDRVRLIRQVTDEGPVRLGKLDPSIPRDLETIVHKATAREPAERYRSAAALASDLRRFLDDRPIAARRPSLLDRSAKWTRRHRTAVITGSLGLLVLISTLAGTAGWIVRDRAARAELTEREVNRALVEADAFTEKDKWPEALGAVKRAEGFLAVGGSKQLEQLVRQRRNDVDMVLRLEAIRLPRPFKSSELAHEQRDWNAEYIAAFRNYGIDVVTLDPADAGELLRGKLIRRELFGAIDHWVDLCLRTRPSSDTHWKRLIAVARAADTDEWRNRLRDALAQGDRAKLQKLVESAAAEDLLAPTLELVLPHLDKQHQLDVLRRAQRQHPDDYWINFKLAYAFDYEPPPLQDQREAVRFYTAALAIRPRNQYCHFYLAEALNHQNRVEEAIAEYQKAIELDPEFSWPSTNLRVLCLKQGKLDLVIAECRRLIERNAGDADAHRMLANVFAQRHLTGESIQEYQKAIASKPTDAGFRNNLAWILVTCAEPSLRNPLQALELAKSAVELDKKCAPCWNTLGVALYRTDDSKGAIKALEQSIAIQGYSSFDGFFLAMARNRLGQPEKAKTEFDRALVWMKQVKPNDAELRLFRDEAAELLQKDKGSPAVPK